MKKAVCILLTLSLALSCAALAEDTALTPGTYEAEAQGFGGPVSVA